jgi:gliding motility-associated-like protein
MNKVLRNSLLSLLLLIFHFDGFCSGMKGKEFCLGFPPNFSSRAKLELQLYSDVFTPVTISIPKKNWQTTVLLMGKQSLSVTLPPELASTESLNYGKNENGIYITSEEEISVYAGNIDSYTSDASFILPYESLKDEYYVIGFWLTWGQTHFLITAAEEETIISIHLSAKPAGLNYNKGETIFVTLKKGETYYLSSYEDLSGTKIKTTDPCKKIAVFAGASCASVICGACDHLYQQMIPTKFLGTNYLLPQLDETSIALRILAIESNTQVQIGTQVINLIPGEPYTQINIQTAMEIRSNKNIMVAMFLQGPNCSKSGDPSFTLLVPTNQFVKEVDIILPELFDELDEESEFFLVFTTKTNTTNQISILNFNAQIQFSTISGTEYSTGTLKVDPGRYIIRSESDFMVIAWGQRRFESYLFSGAIAGNNYQLSLNDDLCKGVINDFEISGLFINAAVWYFNSDTVSGTRLNKAFSEEGGFIGQVVIFSDSENCPDTISFKYQVKSKPIIKLNQEITICQNTNFLLQPEYKDATTIHWSTGDNSKNIQLNEEGWYFVLAENQCGTTKDSIFVNVKPLPDVTLGNDTTILIGTSAQIKGKASEGIYNWYPNTNLSCFGCLSPLFSGQKTQTYVLAVTDKNGCTNRDTINIYVDPDLAVYVPNIFSPNGDGVNDVFYVRGKGIQSMRLMIFNRWGELIFETLDINQGWDGTYKGTYLKTEVFVYHLEAILVNDQRVVKTGDITLLR